MKRSPRATLLHVFSIAFAALPVAFGLIRAAQTGTDLRYIWLALAALLGAVAVVAIGRGSRDTPLRVVALAAAALAVATFLAILTALLLGTRLGPGLLVVASSFGLCCAASCLFHLLASR
jgi:hypothetical protein